MNYPIPLPISESKSTISGCSKISVFVTNVTSKILEANADRKSLAVLNNSGRTLYIDFRSDVSATSYLYPIANNSYLIINLPWVGDIWGIATGNGAIQIREFV